MFLHEWVYSWQTAFVQCSDYVLGIVWIYACNAFWVKLKLSSHLRFICTPHILCKIYNYDNNFDAQLSCELSKLIYSACQRVLTFVKWVWCAVEQFKICIQVFHVVSQTYVLLKFVVYTVDVWLVGMIAHRPKLPFRKLVHLVVFCLNMIDHTYMYVMNTYIVTKLVLLRRI